MHQLMLMLPAYREPKAESRRENRRRPVEMKRLLGSTHGQRHFCSG